MKNWKRIIILNLMIFIVGLSFSQVIIKPCIIIINKKLVNFYHFSEISITIKDDQNKETTFPIKYQIGSIQIDSLDYNILKEYNKFNLNIKVQVISEKNPDFAKYVDINAEIFTSYIINPDYFVLEIQTDPELYILFHTSRTFVSLNPNYYLNHDYETIISSPKY